MNVRINVTHDALFSIPIELPESDDDELNQKIADFKNSMTILIKTVSKPSSELQDKIIAFGLCSDLFFELLSQESDSKFKSWFEANSGNINSLLKNLRDNGRTIIKLTPIDQSNGSLEVNTKLDAVGNTLQMRKTRVNNQPLPSSVPTYSDAQASTAYQTVSNPSATTNNSSGGGSNADEGCCAALCSFCC